MFGFSGLLPSKLNILLLIVPYHRKLTLHEIKANFKNYTLHFTSIFHISKSFTVLQWNFLCVHCQEKSIILSGWKSFSIMDTVKNAQSGQISWIDPYV